MTKRRCYLVHTEQIPLRAAFGVIDAHNHLWSDWDVQKLLAVMDEVGILSYCDLTANVSISWAEGGYVLGEGKFEDFGQEPVDPEREVERIV